MKKYEAHVLCNTHWDREWYMPHESYRVRLVQLMDRMLDILDADPEFHFITDGQSSMVEDYLEVRPEMKERVQKAVRNGRLSVGPWFTQPLETLVTGEAMIRNLHYGIRSAEELGGAMRFAYEVDEFGHASQTPQILREFKIPGALAWRGHWHGMKSAYEWASPDGSSVTMLYSNGGYGEATDLPPVNEDFTETVDGTTIPRPGLDRTVKNLMDLRVPYSESRHLLWLNGIDHSFAQADLSRVLEKLNAEFPEVDAHISTCEKYHDSVLEDLAARGITMKRVEGELMGTAEQLLESTHSYQPRQKKKHYAAEHFLAEKLEPACAMAHLVGADAREWAQKLAWRYVLENHAHDTLGMSSVDEVFEEAMSRYGRALSLAEQTTEDALRDLFACIPGFPYMAAVNTSGYPAKGVFGFDTVIPEGMAKGGFSLTAPDGSDIPCVVLSKEPWRDLRYNPRRGHPTVTNAVRVKGLVSLPETPALGWTTLAIKEKSEEGLLPKKSYFSKSPAVMENEFLKCEICGNGTVCLTDRVSGRRYEGLFIAEDTSDIGNSYVHRTSRTEREIFSTGVAANIALLYDTPLGAAYEVTYSIPVPETSDPDTRSERTVPVDVKLVLSLHAGKRHLGAEVTVNNRACEHRMRLLFPTGLAAAENARGGQPFDIPERPVKVPDPVFPGEELYDGHPMQDFCDVSVPGAGLAVAAEGLYEYMCTDTPDRALAVTLFRANEAIDRSWPYKLKEAECQGEMTWRFGIFPHDGEVRDILPGIRTVLCPPTVEAVRQPETSVLREAKAPAATLPRTGGFAEVNGKNLVVTAFKKAWDRETTVLRIVNYGSEEATGELVWRMPGRNLTGVYRTDADENRLEELPVSENKVAFTLRGAGILTLELVPEEL